MTTTIGYTTDTAYIAFALARGVVVTAQEAAIELTKAMDYLDAQSYQGSKTSSSQTNDWPRQNVYIDDVLIDSTTTPAGIVKAQHVVAMSIHAGNDPLSTIDRAVKREKVDVLEVEYQDKASDRVMIRSINAVLAPFLAGANGYGNGSTSVYRVL